MPLQNPDGKTPEGIATRKTWAISYDLLIPNPNNPRDMTLPEEVAALEELVADLEPGFDTDRPLLVKEVTAGEHVGKFMAFDGNRRYLALGIILARDAEYSRMIPAVKVPAGTSEIDLEYISLRSPSRPLSPLAEANQIFRLIRKGQPEEEIARRMHKGLDYIRGRLELREAPEEIKAALNSKEIAPTEARKLLKTPAPVERLQAARKVADGGKIRTRHVAAATASARPPAPQPRWQEAIERILTAWHGRPARLISPDYPDLAAAIEASRDLLPDNAEAAD